MLLLRKLCIHAEPSDCGEKENDVEASLFKKYTYILRVSHSAIDTIRNHHTLVEGDARSECSAVHGIQPRMPFFAVVVCRRAE